MQEKKGLSKQAYEPIPDGGAYEPYFSADVRIPEFTFKALVPGIFCGILFGAANAYMGLMSGLTISTSIPVAVMAVAAFRAMRGFGVKGNLLEANLAQTVGSASSSVASGLIFTLPALFMWGMPPKLLQMTLLALCGGLLGILFMIPLRRFLIQKEHGHLPYPEGTACAEVLVASEVGGAQARHVFLGLGVGAAMRFVFGWLKVLPGKLHVAIPLLPRGEIAMKTNAALFGVGYILGPRISAVMVGGGLLSALLIIPGFAIWGRYRSEPFYPETVHLISNMDAGQIWERYVRYIGAGTVAAAGLITLFRSIPTMIASFRIGARQLKDRFDGQVKSVPRTADDLSLRVVGVGVLIIMLVMALAPNVFNVQSVLFRTTAAILVVIFSFFFVTVASRIVGLVGVTSNPTSGMTIASLLGTATVFLLIGWTDETGKVTALVVGCVVAIAASISGDTSQDLKTGFLLGATPRKQQIGELIGVMTCAVFVCGTLLLLNESYGFGSKELPAPQATLMKLVIDGVLEQKLPWILVGMGVGIAILCEILRIPSLPFAVGVYLPVATMVPVFLGGLLRWNMERSARSEEERAQRRENGVLFGSGLVGGVGLMGVGICAAAAWQNYGLTKGGTKPPLPLEIGQDWLKSISPAWGPGLAQIGAAVVFVLLVIIFVRSCRDSRR